MTSRIFAAALAAAVTLPIVAAAQAARRPYALDDLAKFKIVADPQISPDGKWIAYTVGSIDSAKDKKDTDVWMASWDGKQTLQLTSSKESESRPRWSPDGKYLAFTASRGDKDEDEKDERKRARRSGCSTAAAARR